MRVFQKVEHYLNVLKVLVHNCATTMCHHVHWTESLPAQVQYATKYHVYIMLSITIVSMQYTQCTVSKFKQQTMYKIFIYSSFSTDIICYDFKKWHFLWQSWTLFAMFCSIAKLAYYRLG